MNITEVRVKLMRNRSDRLRAFCSVTIDDDFVVHDLRVIEGRKGYFVAMPSRKLTDNCPNCGAKNELRARYCNNCGTELDEARATEGPNARDKFHVDVAHPINTPCREELQETVLAAYEAELELVEQGLAPEREYDAEDLEDVIEDYEGLEVEEEEEVEEAEASEPEAEELPEEEVAAPGEAAEEVPPEAEAGELAAGETEEAEELPAPETEEAEELPAPETEELTGAGAEEQEELLEQPAEEPVSRAVPLLPGEEPTEAPEEAEEEKEEEEQEEKPEEPDTGEFGAGIF
ncbi:MAG: SpoVG family protein [Candidatus Brocadiia bacterium]